MGWRDQAECAKRELDPELFFPDPGAPIAREVANACAVCVVRVECLEFVTAMEETREDGEGTKYKIYRHGIWGGYPPNSRTRLRRGNFANPVFAPERIRSDSYKRRQVKTT